MYSARAGYFRAHLDLTSPRPELRMYSARAGYFRAHLDLTSPRPELRAGRAVLATCMYIYECTSRPSKYVEIHHLAPLHPSKYIELHHLDHLGSIIHHLVPLMYHLSTIIHHLAPIDHRLGPIMSHLGSITYFRAHLDLSSARDARCWLLVCIILLYTKIQS